MTHFPQQQTEYTFDPNADKDPTVVPPGIYRLEVVNAEARETQNGDKMWGMEYHVIEPTQFATVLNNCRVFDNIVFSKGSQYFTFKKLFALGLNPQAGQRFVANPQDAMGRKVTAELFHEPQFRDPSRMRCSIRATSVKPDTGTLSANDLSEAQRTEMAALPGGPSLPPSAPSSPSRAGTSTASQPTERPPF